MSNTKQTAVEWFYDKLKNHEIQAEHFELYQQAKEMQKEQHGNTWDAAIKTHEERGKNIARSITDFDDYFTETYGGKNAG